ncbi:MAG: hypothetical protein EBZ36_00705 [Acidobacteria bacterium]|nr:hypothetical protein [Acidobacteriota bacterium]
MKITGITTRIVRLSSEAWYAPHPVPPGGARFFDFPFTTLQTDAGIEGYTSDYCPLGQGPGSARFVHDVFSQDLLGQNPLHHEAIWQRWRLKQRHLYNVSETIWSNLDVALWDIKGKVAGLPIAVLLGQYRDRVPLYATCPPQTAWATSIKPWTWRPWHPCCPRPWRRGCASGPSTHGCGPCAKTAASAWSS